MPDTDSNDLDILAAGIALDSFATHVSIRPEKMKDMAALRDRILRLFDALPEVEIEVGGERDQHCGASVRKKRFAWYIDDHHGDGTVSVTCKAAEGINTAMVDEDSDRYFIPSYTGPKGWVGIRLDVEAIDWDRAELCIRDAYRMTAPKSLARELDTA